MNDKKKQDQHCREEYSGLQAKSVDQLAQLQHKQAQLETIRCEIQKSVHAVEDERYKLHFQVFVLFCFVFFFE